MSLATVRALLPLSDSELVPPPDLFLHHSDLHGQAHVARVLVHALRLIEATGYQQETARLWAAVYLHDIARRHDGSCRRHGRDAWTRLATLPEVEALFARGGVQVSDYRAIETAVSRHCDGETAREHPHWRLASLLKDADGLDRVRLGDLDPRYFRHEQTRTMVGFAERLYEYTETRLRPSPDYFAKLWPAVPGLLSKPRG